MSAPFLGEIRIFAGNYAPTGWATCDGQLLSIAQNTALFSIIGTTFGGDGMQTFGLPNFAARVPMHQGQGNGTSQYNVGDSGGAATVTLTTSQMPEHLHPANANSGAGTSNVGTHNIWAATALNRPVYLASNGNTSMSGQALSPAGGNQAHNNLQAYLPLTFIIAITGIFPTRG